MSGAIPPLPQYAFMAWCSVEARGQIYICLYLIIFLSFCLLSVNPFCEWKIETYIRVWLVHNMLQLQFHFQQDFKLTLLVFSCN
jgi:hypothetical protein